MAEPKKHSSYRLSNLTLSQLDELQKKFEKDAERGGYSALNKTEIIEEAVAQYYANHFDKSMGNTYLRNIKTFMKQLFRSEMEKRDEAMNRTLYKLSEITELLYLQCKVDKNLPQLGDNDFEEVIYGVSRFEEPINEIVRQKLLTSNEDEALGN